MKLAVDLLKATHIGIRELKTNLSRRLKTAETLVVTDRGMPTNVILPYADMIELLDIIDEITDSQTMATIQEARKSMTKGNKGVSVSRFIKSKKE